jgi:hypothetical protein
MISPLRSPSQKGDRNGFRAATPVVDRGRIAEEGGAGDPYADSNQCVFTQREGEL